MNCKHWREYDSEETGAMYEYCKAKGEKCSCTGVRIQCNYPDYFNIPKHRIKAQKKKDSINKTIAAVMPERNG